MWGKLIRNPKPVMAVIAVFVVLLITLFSCESRASELRLEAGSAVLRGETPTLGFTVAYPQAGPVNTDYEFGFTLIGESSHYTDNPNQIQLHANLYDSWKRVGLGFGFYWQNVQNEYTCTFGFHLIARYHLSERATVQWRHSSTAGSCRPNAGRDLVTVGWRF